MFEFLLFFWIAAGIFIFFYERPQDTCRNCGRSHGHSNSRYYNSQLGEKFSYKNGYVFHNKECSKEFWKNNIVCEQCNGACGFSSAYELRSNKDRFYFCKKDCKLEFINQNDNLNFSVTKRHSIPTEVRKFVWDRDKGICCKCGSNMNIHFDHIIPVSKGGSNNIENIELLCQDCN